MGYRDSIESEREYKRLYAKKWRAANPQRNKEIHAAYRLRGGDALKARRKQENLDWRRRNADYRSIYERRYLLSAYGLTLEAYEEMQSLQDNKCAICLNAPTNFINQYVTKTRLIVDHCHKTGKVRQLLCTTCNNLLGFAKDKPEVLERAISYLKRHSE